MSGGTQRTKSAQRTEDKAARLLAVAAEIIRETGDFDLPMRELAARAQVSLRDPYQLFGSKAGLITALLKADQAVFHDKVRALPSSDVLDNLFERVRIGVEFFAENQPFYRALFRATQGYSGGDETEPARENLRAFRSMARRASREGYIEDDIDPEILGETLTDIFAANLRSWAAGGFDIHLCYLKIGFGMAQLLTGAATAPHDVRLRERRRKYQAQIRAFESASQGAQS
jgi:AcrR family transcriptional regulator